MRAQSESPNSPVVLNSCSWVCVQNEANVPLRQLPPQPPTGRSTVSQISLLFLTVVGTIAHSNTDRCISKAAWLSAVLFAEKKSINKHYMTGQSQVNLLSVYYRSDGIHLKFVLLIVCLSLIIGDVLTVLARDLLSLVAHCVHGISPHKCKPRSVMQ